MSYLQGLGAVGNAGSRMGNMKLDLPVDEDDYLMPSPNPSQLPSLQGGYMDLIGDSKLGGTSFGTVFILNVLTFVFL